MTPSRSRFAPLTHRRSGGAVIIIVLMLLSTLAFLGFFFYEWTDQEQKSAQAYATADAAVSNVAIEPVFDQAFEQLIVGARSSYPNSVLSGNKHSILPHIVGPINPDLQPMVDHAYSGQGMTLVMPIDTDGDAKKVPDFPDNDGDGNPEIGIDYNGDGISDRSILNVAIDSSVSPWTYRYIAPDPSAPSYTEACRMTLNFSRVAQPNPLNDAFNSLLPLTPATANPFPLPFFNPAAGYSYPDLNSLFLAYDSANFVDLNNDGTFDDFSVPPDGIPDMLRIAVPSFFRPQLDLDRRDSNGGAAGVTANTVASTYGNGQNGFVSMFVDAKTRDRVLRPHAMHQTPDTTGSFGPQARFLFARSDDPAAVTGIQAQSGDTNRMIRPFEIMYDTDGDGVYESSGPDPNGNGIPNEMGIYTDASIPSLPNAANLELDVDTDGDGVRDAIWMDLGLPMITLADGRQVVPLVAFKVLDGDGLFNVNLHGNLAGLYATDTQSTGLLIDWNANGSFDAGVDTNSTGYGDSGDTASDVFMPVHRSNMGLSPSEVNIGWGLMSDPMQLSTDAQLAALYDYLQMSFTGTVSATNAAGLLARASADQMFLLSGRIAPGGNLFDGPFLPGRHGEPGLVAGYYSNQLPTPPWSPYPPRAGISVPSYLLSAYPAAFADDNRDYFNTGGLGLGATNPTQLNTDPTMLGIPMPPAVHPLDFSGSGLSYLNTGTNGAIRRLAQPYTNNPSSWPQYDANGAAGQWVENGWNNAITSQYKVYPYTFAAPGTPAANALQKSGISKLIDEDSEITVNSSYLDPQDAVYPPSEIAGLQMPESDFRNSGEVSRIRDLASFNLRDSFTSALNRRRFTTDSWDRLEFVYNVTPNEMGDVDGNGSPTPSEDFNKNGILDINLGEDVNGNGFLDLAEDRNGDGDYTDVYPRGWEMNTWNFAALPTYPYTWPNQFFPPRFPKPTMAMTDTSQPFWTAATDVRTSTDPVRWELRKLLLTRFLNRGAANNFDSNHVAPRLKLNLNRLLVGIDSNGNPLYRQLTPHPVFIAGDTGTLTKMYHGQHFNQGVYTETTMPTGGSVTYPNRPDYTNYNSTAGRYAQEWWARYDRQRMCRDIYTLLYITSGGNDFNDYTQSLKDTSVTDDTGTVGLEQDSFDATTPEGRDRCREMAQFAVNLVDELDRDSVITKFEYDENLTNGWDVAADGGAASIMPAVYGVEAAQLTFSEGLAVQTTPGPDTKDIIEFNDAVNIHYHTFIELRNASAFNVPVNDSQWRVRRVDLLATKTDLGFTIKDAAINGSGLINAGDNYIIGSQDGDNKFPTGTNHRPSDLRIDYADSTPSKYTLVCPNYVEPVGDIPTAGTTEATYNGYNGGKGTYLDLDLFYEPHNGRFTPGADNAPAILDRINGPSTDSAGTPYIMLALERRQSTNDVGGTGGLTDADNPWIEVDRISVPVKIWNPDGSTVLTEVQKLTSVERKEIFSPDLRPAAYGGADTNIKNTMPNFTPAAVGTGIERNSLSPAALTAWQPQFDRDFASVIEILSTPLYGYFTAETTAAIDTNLYLKSDGTSDTSGEARMFRVGGPTKNLLDANNLMSGHRIASVRMLYPEPAIPTKLINPATKRTGLSGSVEVQKHYRNRWHRLLEFVTVPDRAEQSVANRLRWQRRVPGLINLNTLRDEPVMAGLVDDPIHLQPYNQFLSPTNDILEGGNIRNWYRELRQSRDGLDPFLQALTFTGTTTTGALIPLPGSVNSQPFRNTDQLAWTSKEEPSMTPVQREANADQRDLSVRNSILRSRIIDSNDADMPPDNSRDLPDHGLFEARKAIDRTGANGGTGENTVDFHTRNRLLAKIDNRTTNRSNVFFIWATVGYFEAHQLSTTGEVQIGAQADDLPVRRAFAVADMTRIEEAYTDPNPYDALPGSFDFRKFIIYRKLFK
jgi:hypothetical protein